MFTTALCLNSVTHFTDSQVEAQKAYCDCSRLPSQGTVPYLPEVSCGAGTW